MQTESRKEMLKEIDAAKIQMEESAAKIELETLMAHAIGTENYYRDPLLPFLYTDGVKTFCEHCGCFWILMQFALLTRKQTDYFAGLSVIVKDRRVKIKLHSQNEDIEKTISTTAPRHGRTGKYIPDGVWLFYHDKDAKVLMYHTEY